MRALATLLLSLAASGPAGAQILAVHFTDEKTASKYEKYLVDFGGDRVVLGEPYTAISYDAEKRVVSYPPDKRFELLVADPKKPGAVPYRLDDGERVVTNKKGVLGIQGPQVQRISVFNAEQSLYGLSKEYEVREAEIERITEQRDDQVKGSREWFLAHRRLLTHYDRLHTWLLANGYEDPAKKLDKERQRQAKTVAGEALELRHSAGKEAIETVEPFEELVEASQEITDGEAVFRVLQSQHVRIVCLEEIPEVRLQRTLEFAEDAIEGFRREFIDPYVDSAYEDEIPDRLFVEFFFGPEDKSDYEAFYTDYYGFSWGSRKEEKLEMSGTRGRQAFSPQYVDYWKLKENTDIEGIVAHSLGHVLANLHYDQGKAGMQQDWIQEGVGFYLALEYFGRNSVTCKAFEDPARTRYVAKKVKQEGEKTVQLGLRDYYNALALDYGRPIDQMALRTLFEMDDADLAKSWSFFDFIAKREGKRGQLLLRAACKHARTNKKTLIEEWRAKAEELYEVEGQDVFKQIDGLWREFAELGQDTGDTRRAR